MYTLITPTQLDYVPRATDLIVAPNANVTLGNGCLSSAATIFEDKGYWFRNRIGRSLIVVRNDHEYLSAYIRVITSATVNTLGIADIIAELPAGSGIHLIKGFSNIFHALGTITETNQGANDLVKINLAHDAADAAVSIGVYYV